MRNHLVRGRAIAGCLALAIAAPLAAGCGGSDESGSGRTDSGAGGTGTGASPTVTEHARLIGYLSHPRPRTKQACPVTRDRDRRERIPGPLLKVLHGDLRGAYGRGPLWVLLPAGKYNVFRVFRDRKGRVYTKVGWYVGVPGRLRGVARRLDGRKTATGHLDTSDPRTDAPRMQASTLTLASEGCWQVAGRVGRHVLVWTFRARLERKPVSSGTP